MGKMDTVAAAFGGWIGEAVVQNLLDKVSSYLQNQFGCEAKKKSALEKLQTTLLPVKLVLEKAEERELNLDKKPELAKWIWKLRDAVEEAEDVLDDMKYDELERQISERDAKEGGKPVAISGLSVFSKVQASCSSSMHKFMKIVMDPTLDKLNSAVENFKLVSEKIDVLNDAIDKSPLRGGGSNNSIRHNQPLGPALTVDKVFGRDQDKLEVLQMLKESGGDDRLSALTISGVGGVGKTTLAQFVYNDDSLDFKVKMWVCVSNNNDTMEVLIQKAIASATKNPTKPDTTNLQEELINVVKSKRCLLVLDDVWVGQSNQNAQQWENFISVLSKHAENGSRIIITSRTHSVAEAVLQCLAIKKKSFLLGRLQEDESLSLFNKHAFVGAHLSDRNILKEVGEKIAKKCGGLPLALKMMGGLLNAKLDYKYWVSVSEKNILDLRADVKEVLKLSYQCLPSNLQSCFRTCSLFPQDYRFRKDELITLWIGLGCINQNRDANTQTDEDIGQDYLDELVRRSFFVYNWGGYTMHDLLHDLARDVSKDECLRIERNNGDESVVLTKTLRHLFIDQLNSNLVTEISSLKRLRTLALTYHYNNSSYPDYDYGQLSDILKQLRSLRALFICIQKMPDLIIVQPLKHLRLFHMKVRTLNMPLDPLYKLYQLQNLICEEYRGMASEVHNAQFSIANLAKLRHLVLPHRIFDEITELRHLVELHKVELHLKKDNALKLSDIKDLNKLHHLVINCECPTMSLEEAKETNLVEKEHLETLSLIWTKCDPHHHEEIYNCLRPRQKSNIKCLEVKNYNGLTAPTWVASSYLPFVTDLRLAECKNLVHLPPLGQLQSLKFLILEDIDGVKLSGAEFFGNGDTKGFQSLENLYINRMEYWEEWTNIENTSWFPRLKKLHIKNCPQLKALPALPLSLKILLLDSIGLVALPTWQDVDVHELNTSRYNAPLLEDLKIVNCQELMNFRLLLGKCNCLKRLHIKSCKSLRELPTLPLSLTNLKLEEVGLIALPSWQDMYEDEESPSLEDLYIFNCKELVYVQPFLRKCAFLKNLEIWLCPKILGSDGFDLNQVTSSTCLDLIGLSSLTTLELVALEKIRTLDCAKARSLQKLSIKRWENLISLAGLQALASLKELTIGECNKLSASSSSSAAESFDQTHSPFSLYMPSSLTALHIYSCPLKSLPENMPSALKYLEIRECLLLESLPKKMPSSLESLVIRNCPLLKSLPDESSLRRLELLDCPALELLPNQMLLTLNFLYIRAGCPLLSKWYYRNGGPDWPNVAHITKLCVEPDKDEYLIFSEEE